MKKNEVIVRLHTLANNEDAKSHDSVTPNEEAYHRLNYEALMEAIRLLRE